MKQNLFKNVFVFFTVLLAEIEYSIRINMFKRKNPGLIEAFIKYYKLKKDKK